MSVETVRVPLPPKLREALGRDCDARVVGRAERVQEILVDHYLPKPLPCNNNCAFCGFRVVAKGWCLNERVPVLRVYREPVGLHAIPPVIRRAEK